jgi:hypothetical protein
MVNIKIDIKGVEQLQSALTKASNLGPALGPAMKDCGWQAGELIRSGAPVDTGHLAGGTGLLLVSNYLAMVGTNFGAVPYSIYPELGTRYQAAQYYVRGQRGTIEREATNLLSQHIRNYIASCGL